MIHKVLDYLDNLNVKYELTRHEAVFAMDDLKRIELDKIGLLCKNLFLRDYKGKQHYLIIADDSTQIDLKEFGKKTGLGHLSFASAERLTKYLGVTPGCVSPLGVLNDAEHSVTVIFDSKLVGVEKMGVHPNVHDATVWISFDDLVRVVKAAGNEVRIMDL